MDFAFFGGLVGLVGVFALLTDSIIAPLRTSLYLLALAILVMALFFAGLVLKDVFVWDFLYGLGVAWGSSVALLFVGFLLGRTYFRLKNGPYVDPREMSQEERHQKLVEIAHREKLKSVKV